MNHHSEHNSSTSKTEYVKFASVLLAIAVGSYVHAKLNTLTIEQYMSSFMGVFFLVFGLFKLVNLSVFANGFADYDILAKRSVAYGYAYPFIQLLFAGLYLFDYVSIPLHVAVLVISTVSAVGVIMTLQSKVKVHCVCLGNVIKLPLSTISLVEDLGMAIMAAVMIMY